MTWEKIVHHVGTIYGQDISNELQNRTTVVIDKPEHDQAILDQHALRVTQIKANESRLLNARLKTESALEVSVKNDEPGAIIKLAELQNAMADAEFKAKQEIPIQLTEEQKVMHNNEWCTYREREATLQKQRGQAFSMIRGQCMQVLLDKMKHDPDWTATSESYDPLTLYKMIEKTVLAQTEDQYPFATVYEQECSLYGFAQHSLTNDQWYERFNTKVEVGASIGVTRQHKVLWEYVSEETHRGIDFTSLTHDQQQAIKEDAEERYLSYIFLRQSGKQHSKLKMDLQNDFTTGDNRYPTNRQATLHLLDKYTKTAIVNQPISEGTAFAQRGGKGKKDKEPFDKSYWKDKTCYECQKKGHPSSHCPNKGAAGKDDDDKSKSTKSSTSSTVIRKLRKDFKKQFTTMEARIEELNEDSDLTDSDDESAEGHSHFQYGTLDDDLCQGVQDGMEPEIAGVSDDEGIVLHQGLKAHRGRTV